MNYTKQIFDSLIFWRVHSLFSCRKDKKIYLEVGTFNYFLVSRLKKLLGEFYLHDMCEKISPKFVSHRIYWVRDMHNGLFQSRTALWRI